MDILMDNSNNNSKKVAVVTGASRGIGKAIAIQLAKDGFQLALCCARNTQLLLELKVEIEGLGVPCLIFTGDLGDNNSVCDFFKEIVEKYGHIDVLVNNAGISHIGLLQDMSPEQWNEIIQTNLSSVFYCCRQAIPLMLDKHQGKIISISSIWGEYGASTEVAYSTTKGGINAFTRALAKELGPSNIQINAIACGLIDTDMNCCFDSEEIHAILEEIPAGRMGKPEEVGALVSSLCTAPSYLTGQIIGLDGAWI